MKKTAVFAICLLLYALGGHAGGQKEADAGAGPLLAVTDALGRSVEVPSNPQHVICSGSGCLRLLTYLQCQERVVAVDDIEGRREKFDARPYALANPRFQKLPVFGEFRGHDNPELIVALDPLPQLIFKTYASMGTDPSELQKKTGIPVVALSYGDLFGYKNDLYAAIRTMAKVLDREARGEEVISYFESSIADLQRRTSDIPAEQRRSCYVGGIASKGPHGLQSTEPTYPPFMFIKANNVAYDPVKSLKELAHADVAKEKIVAWDPEVLFVDVSTIQSDPQASALYELEHDPAYRGLRAVKNGQVYGLLPYNWYTTNFDSLLANAYFVGKVLYPDRFTDIEAVKKADEIYQFFVGKEIFRELEGSFANLVFKRIAF